MRVASAAASHEGVRPKRTRRLVTSAACCALGLTVARFLGDGEETRSASLDERARSELAGGLRAAELGSSPRREVKADRDLPAALVQPPPERTATHVPKPAADLVPRGGALALPRPVERPEFIELPIVALDGREAPLGAAAVAHWGEEANDPAWSQAMTNHIEEALRDLEIDGELLETSCRSTLCRVQMRFESLDHARAFAEAAGRPTQREFARVRVGGEDALSLEVFVSRER